MWVDTIKAFHSRLGNVGFLEECSDEMFRKLINHCKRQSSGMIVIELSELQLLRDFERRLKEQIGDSKELTLLKITPKPGEQPDRQAS